jgi:hypothetical protein
MPLAFIIKQLLKFYIIKQFENNCLTSKIQEEIDSTNKRIRHKTTNPSCVSMVVMDILISKIR